MRSALVLLFLLPLSLLVSFQVPGEENLGWQLVERGLFEEAREVFEKRLAADPADLRARVGLQRTRIEDGHALEVLEATDELERAGATETDLAYLRGMAHFARAKASLGDGTGGPLTASQFEDAWRQLKYALDNAPQSYGDAWFPRAEAAWYSQALEDADHAAHMAMRRDRVNTDIYLLWGKVRFSQYAVAIAEEQDEERQEAYWQAANECFLLALELLIGTEDWARQAEAALQLGHLHGWKEEIDKARTRYAEALACDPDRVDVEIVRSTLGREAFAACMDEAVTAFETRFGPEDVRRATLLWWQGYAHLDLEHWDRAEPAFAAAHGLWPEYNDTWYYRFRCHFAQGRHGDAAEALGKLAEADQVTFASLITDTDRESIARAAEAAPGDANLLELLRLVTEDDLR